MTDKNLNLIKRISTFVKQFNEHSETNTGYIFEKIKTNELDSSFLNKKAIVSYMNESGTINHATGLLKIASNKAIREGHDLEIVNKNENIGLKLENILLVKCINDGSIKEYKVQLQETKKPIKTNKLITEQLKCKMKNLLKSSINTSSINEEIVNAKHAGTMTKKEIKSRDKIAKKVKAKPIKGKDTPENAKYRLATYIELRKRGQEPKGKKSRKKKK